MAITYTDKVQNVVNPLPVTEQWRAVDANEVKTEVNTHLSNTSNPHSVTAAQVGLGNVDNTSDADKPVSTAQQAALDLTVGSIAGVVSLTSSDLGKLWIVTGTTTAYTVDLPTAVGNENKTITLKGSDLLTQNVTIAGISGQTIEGESGRVLGKGGSFTLLSDGANWKLVNEVGSWITYTPVWGGFSADPAIARAAYFREGKKCTVLVAPSANGTSNATTLTVTLPFPAAISSNHFCIGFNNNTLLTVPARIDLTTGSSIATGYTSAGGAAWTNINGKRVAFTVTYEIQ